MKTVQAGQPKYVITYQLGNGNGGPVREQRLEVESLEALLAELNGSTYQGSIPQVVKITPYEIIESQTLTD